LLLSEGLDWVARLLDAKGKVLPLCIEPLEIYADVLTATGQTDQVRGQVQVATTPHKIQAIGLEPKNPVVCEQAVASVRNADFVVLGPGSWYTSVLTHFQVQDELSRLPVTKKCCRKAEVSALLRFAGGLHIVSGKIVVEAELDTGQAARRLRRDLAEIFGHESEVSVLSGAGIRKGSRYLVRVALEGEHLAKQVGLVDGGGRPIRGLPPHIVSASLCDAEAAWRGAFLAHGSLTEPGRSSSLEITCPGPEAALALVGSARRLGIAAKAREVRGVDRVVIRDGDAIGALLTRIGAHESVLAWEERRMRREVRATANRLANFDDANLRRSARAAVAAGARAARAIEILGDEIPAHLLEAGQLRVTHQQASLEELGALADPPMTKDAIAGRIRRLLAMADKRASDLGIPNTEAGLTADMLEQ
jgi:DNA-binding protein WhiA